MKIIADLHTHTNACPHGHTTRAELITHAKMNGLCALGISEHVQAYPDGVPMSYFANMENWPRTVDGLRLLRGAESDVNDYRGLLSLQTRFMGNLDYLIASVHRSSVLESDGLTAEHLWHGVAEIPYVDIIAHPERERYRWPYSLRPVLQAFKEGDKVVEVNEACIHREEHYRTAREIVEICGELGIPLMLGTDSHYCQSVGRMNLAIALVQEVGYPEEMVINADVARLDAWLARRAEIHKAYFPR